MKATNSIIKSIEVAHETFKAIEKLSFELETKAKTDEGFYNMSVSECEALIACRKIVNAIE